MIHEVSTEDIKLVIRLGATDSTERIEAAQLLEQRGLYTVEGLQAILNTVGHRRQKQRKWFAVGRYTLFFALCLLQDVLQGHGSGLGWTLFWLFLTGILASAIRQYLYRPFRRGMAEALSRFDDVRLVGPLIEACRGESRVIVRPVLIRLLLRLQHSDSALLRKHHREKLYLELSYCHDATSYAVDDAFMLAILKALEQVGDDQAIVPVEKVLARAEREQIRKAAQDCLERLRARAASGQHTLLRAATASGEDLLRAAHGGHVKEPNALLSPRQAPLPEELEQQIGGKRV